MNATPPVFRPLDGIYEPSAIQQLPDGRFLVVEDEKDHPFSLVSIGLDGRIECQALTPGFFEFNDTFWKLDDLEGLAMDQSGYVYAITSHSRDNDGDTKKARDKIVRFRVEAQRIVDTAVSLALKPALCERHPVLAAAAAILDVKNQGGLNIEALDFCPRTRHLLIGLRSPLQDAAFADRLAQPAPGRPGDHRALREPGRSLRRRGTAANRPRVDHTGPER